LNNHTSETERRVVGRSSIKILLAEDDPITRLLYSRTLSACGYQVVTAANGEEAWARLLAEPVQILISDWEMPVLTGLELCRRVKSSTVLPYVFTILLTARDDVSSLIQGLDIGADDYLAKTGDMEVLKARVRSAGRIIHLTAELEAKNLKLQDTNAQLDKAYSYIKRDLELAAKAQIGLLPPQDLLIAGVRFNWLFVPADFIGGDTLNYFRRDEHQLVFYQLDVAGHGVASALHSFSLTRILSPDTHDIGFNKSPGEVGALDQSGTAADIVADLNRRFQSGADLSIYFTMAYGILDLRDLTVDLCLAGHQKPIHVSKGGKPVQIGQNGFPVGIFPESDFASSLFQFARGDRLFLHSDGISECMGADGEEFGVERLQALLDEARHEDLGSVGKIVMDRLGAWKGDSQFEDDISLLALEITEI